MKKRTKNNDNELLEILQKHIVIKENPKEDALDIYVKCNGISVITLPRNYIKLHDCRMPSQDTLDLERFKELICNSEDTNKT